MFKAIAKISIHTNSIHITVKDLPNNDNHTTSVTRYRLYIYLLNKACHQRVREWNTFEYVGLHIQSFILL